MTSHLMLAGALLCVMAAGPLMAASGGIREVALSSGGLAEVTRVHAVDGDETIPLSVTAEQIDDILKSLVVRDPGGAVGGLSLDGPDQAEETFRRMPFKAEDLASAARLAGTLQGIAVRVESAGRTIEGRVLGVSEREAGSEHGAVRVLSVLAEGGGIASVALEDGASLTILDPDTVARVAAAVDAAGRARADGARRIEIALTGRGRREVRITYVVAAPVWKTSYRIVDDGDGHATLQAWAVVENATGEDWTGVRVTLSSGAPVTLRQRLHRRYWRDRPEAPVAVEDVGMPEIDPGTVARTMARSRSASRGPAAAPAPMLAAPAPPPGAQAESAYDLSPATQAVDAAEGDVAARFALPRPLDLPAGRTLSVPIIDARIAAERIALWRPGHGVHPIAALAIRNDTAASLPPGLVTVYDGRTGYVGDARLPATPVGERRMASFAADRKVSVQAETHPSEVLTRLSVVDGVAHATTTLREATAYRVKGAGDGDRTVVIEHPRRDGWTFSSPARDEETPGAYRLRVAVPAGGTAEVEAVLERTHLEAYALADADEDRLSQWGRAATDPRLSAGLAALSRARAEAAAVEREIAGIEDRERRVGAEQERIRANLGVVPKDSELARRYLAGMSTQEDELAKAGAARAQAKARLETVQAEIRRLIEAL